MRFTVFTPTYNREYTLPRLLESLKKQTFHDFEWLVINDGSTDNTQELLTNWQKEELPFVFRFETVPNGGKHRAINRGLEHAKGELFFIVDSDDWLPANSLAAIDKWENTIVDKASYAGVYCPKTNSNEPLTELAFSGKEYLDITYMEFSKYNISGEMAEVYYTNVLRKYPFPTFPGEKFITECVVWNAIAHDGLKLRLFNGVVYWYEYLPDGLTRSGRSIFINSPKGYAYYLLQSHQLGTMDDGYFNIRLFEYFDELKWKLPFSEICENLHLSKLRMIKIIEQGILRNLKIALYHPMPSFIKNTWRMIKNV